MRGLLILAFMLASCAREDSLPSPNNIASSEPKPAIREQYVPGTTFGNVALQMKTVDAVKHAYYAKANTSGCRDSQLKVLETWPLGEPSTSEYSSAFLRWTELWTVNACGNDMDFKIIFMLHSESGHIDLELSRLKEGQTLELSRAGINSTFL